MSSQGIKKEGRSYRHLMPSTEAVRRCREPLRHARTEVSECAFISRMAGGQFTTRVSKEFCRVRGIRLGGNSIILALPGRGDLLQLLQRKVFCGRAPV